ncbi:MAG: hypothetical protein IPL34_20400 [Thiofilum sp.]|uniref:hypothetical protein n=1 Tax=Thiofilum sp. TaxID=2212733 RepID=UPI0025DFA0CC|nr:hypothetical protein [Thiofilum sp.]MBK8455644.1 hypothetical protein [Thiofilum sp.]
MFNRYPIDTDIFAYDLSLIPLNAINFYDGVAKRWTGAAWVTDVFKLRNPGNTVFEAKPWKARNTLNTAWLTIDVTGNG